MKYEAPAIALLFSASDPIMVSLDDLFAINLWDMLLEEGEYKNAPKPLGLGANFIFSLRPFCGGGNHRTHPSLEKLMKTDSFLQKQSTFFIPFYIFFALFSPRPLPLFYNV